MKEILHGIVGRTLNVISETYASVHTGMLIGLICLCLLSHNGHVNKYAYPIKAIKIWGSNAVICGISFQMLRKF